MATAVLDNHRPRGFESRIGITQGIASGEKYYRVNDSSDLVALATVLAAVPVGTAYDASFPSCLSADYQIVGAIGGWTWVRIGYGMTTDAGSIDGSATSTTKFHKLNTSVAQQEIYSDISGNPVPRTTINVGAAELEVTAYRTGTQWATALAHWLDISMPAPRRNSNSVSIPAKLDVSGSGFTATANQLLPLTIEDEVVKTDLVRVRYRFAIGPSGTHAFTYRNLDADGNPTGSPVTRQVYDSVSINGSNQLW